MKISVITPSIRPEGLKVVQESLANQTFQDFEWLTEIGFGKEMTLNKDMNKMLRRAKGELIVSLQDYISIPSDGLDRFWLQYLLNKNLFMTSPVGKTLDWKDIRWDWRGNGKIREIEPAAWEIDWAAAPLKAFQDVGGFDEDFDRGWSWENANLAMRAEKLGYKFIVMTENKAVAYDHDVVMDHPFRDKIPNNDTLAEIKRDAIEKGDWKLGYLTRLQ